MTQLLIEVEGLTAKQIAGLLLKMYSLMAFAEEGNEIVMLKSGEDEAINGLLRYGIRYSDPAEKMTFESPVIGLIRNYEDRSIIEPTEAFGRLLYSGEVAETVFSQKAKEIIAEMEEVKH